MTQPKSDPDSDMDNTKACLTTFYSFVPNNGTCMFIQVQPFQPCTALIWVIYILDWNTTTMLEP